ncbi:MAG: hypothetical protein AAF975_06630 [Spirochaetota bacterium]
MSKYLLHCSPEELYQLVYKPLHDWMEVYGISYPWSYPWSYSRTRNLPDSYAVWVSEVMLQQTRVEHVRSYYSAWMQRWPSLAVFARAAEAEVLKQWEGLGYYSRALNMLACARQCVDDQGRSELPTSFAELRHLRGIGPYIAAAVASISGNEAVLALDTNVKRIFSRLYQQPLSRSVESQWQEQHRGALELCDWRGHANLSWIQLGQQICKSVKGRSASKMVGPDCSRCPLRGICPAAAKGNWNLFPRPKVYRRSLLQSRKLLLRAEGKYLLQRKTQGHLQHLWRFPDLQQFEDLGGKAILETRSLGRFSHSYLQTQEKIEVFSCESASSCCEWDEKLLSSEFEWLWAESFAEITVPGPYRRFLEAIGLNF